MDILSSIFVLVSQSHPNSMSSKYRSYTVAKLNNWQSWWKFATISDHGNMLMLKLSTWPWFLRGGAETPVDLPALHESQIIFHFSSNCPKNKFKSHVKAPQKTFPLVEKSLLEKSTTAQNKTWKTFVYSTSISIEQTFSSRRRVVRTDVNLFGFSFSQISYAFPSSVLWWMKGANNNKNSSTVQTFSQLWYLIKWWVTFPE